MNTQEKIYNFDKITENEIIIKTIKSFDYYSLEHDNEEDNRIFIDHMNRYTYSNKKTYNSIESKIKKINKKYQKLEKKLNYEFYICNDVSGYDYWLNCKDSNDYNYYNYFSLVIYFNDNFDINTIDLELFNTNLDNFLSDINFYLSNYYI